MPLEADTAVLAPTDGVVAPATTISISVLSDTAQVFTPVVWAAFAASGSSEMIWHGAGFTPRYASSTRTEVDGGYTFDINRVGGWPSSPILNVTAYDEGGSMITVQQAGTEVAARSTLNFVSGVSVVDDGANDRVNISVAPSGGQGGVSGTIAVVSADVLVQDTTTAALIFGAEVAADSVPVGGRLRVRLGGDHRNQSGSNAFWTLIIRLGGVVLWQGVTQTYTSQANRRAWTLEFDVQRKTGSSENAHLVGQYASYTTASTPTTGIGLTNDTASTGTPITSGVAAGGTPYAHPTVDWTVDQDLEIEITPSFAHANTIFACRSGGAELV